MYICLMYSTELLKGTLKTIILKLLAENGKMYGYEITQRVKSISDGKLVLTEGALYPTLHKLEANGFLITEKVSIGNRVRKYYALTPKGQLATTEKMEEFLEFVQTMKIVLGIKVI